MAAAAPAAVRSSSAPQAHATLRDSFGAQPRAAGEDRVAHGGRELARAFRTGARERSLQHRFDSVGGVHAALLCRASNSACPHNMTSPQVLSTQHDTRIVPDAPRRAVENLNGACGRHRRRRRHRRIDVGARSSAGAGSTSPCWSGRRRPAARCASVATAAGPSTPAPPSSRSSASSKRPSTASALDFDALAPSTRANVLARHAWDGDAAPRPFRRCRAVRRRHRRGSPAQGGGRLQALHR